MGKSKAAGITPTIVNGSPSSVTEAPTIAGSLENRDDHNVELITAIFGPPARSSAAAIVRPDAGVTPSSSKKSPVITAAFSTAASPRPVSVAGMDA